MTQPAVEIRRGDVLDCEHYADLVAVEATADGPRRIAAWGDPQRVTFPRSSLKPLQATVSWEAGIARLGLQPGSPELAVMCASHGATPDQLAAVRSILAAAGLDETVLRTGTHPPPSKDGQAALAAEGGPPRPIHGNCSGKHAGMLAACVVNGWPLDSYLEVDHPLQRMVRRRLAERMRLTLEQVRYGMDGCGLPTWAAPLEACAFAFGQLTWPDDEPMAAASTAMQAHPRLVGVPEGFNVKLMEAAPQLVAKTGADGVICVAHLARREALAIKIRDGSARGLPPLTVDLVDQLGWLEPGQAERLAEFRELELTNLAGAPAATLRSVVRLGL